eukprot:2616238-Rhodomonas_salina.1
MREFPVAAAHVTDESEIQVLASTDVLPTALKLDVSAEENPCPPTVTTADAFMPKLYEDQEITESMSEVS